MTTVSMRSGMLRVFLCAQWPAGTRFAQHRAFDHRAQASGRRKALRPLTSVKSTTGGFMQPVLGTRFITPKCRHEAALSPHLGGVRTLSYPRRSRRLADRPVTAIYPARSATVVVIGCW